MAAEVPPLRAGAGGEAKGRLLEEGDSGFSSARPAASSGQEPKEAEAVSASPGCAAGLQDR